MLNYEYALKDLKAFNKHYFEKMCMRCYLDDIVPSGIGQVLCSESEYVLYEHGGATIRLRLWSKILSLHISNDKGNWIFNSRIDGMSLKDAFDFAYMQAVSGICQMFRGHSKLYDHVNAIIHMDKSELSEEERVVAYLLYVESRRCIGPQIVSRKELQSQLDISEYKMKKLLKSLRDKHLIELKTSGGYDIDSDKVWCYKGYATVTDTITSNKKYAEMKLIYELQNEIDEEDCMKPDNFIDLTSFIT